WFGGALAREAPAFAVRPRGPAWERVASPPDGMTAPDITAAQRAIWSQHRDGVAGRVAVLERAVTALIDGVLDDELGRKAEPLAPGLRSPRAGARAAPGGRSPARPPAGSGPDRALPPPCSPASRSCSAGRAPSARAGSPSAPRPRSSKASAPRSARRTKSPPP